MGLVDLLPQLRHPKCPGDPENPRKGMVSSVDWKEVTPKQKGPVNRRLLGSGQGPDSSGSAALGHTGEEPGGGQAGAQHKLHCSE